MQHTCGRFLTLYKLHLGAAGLGRGLDTPDAVQLIEYLSSSPEDKKALADLLRKAKVQCNIAARSIV